MNSVIPLHHGQSAAQYFGEQWGCESPGTGQGSQELCPRQPGQKGRVVFLALLPPMTVSTEPTAKVFRVAGVVNFKSVTSNETVIKRSCPLHLRMP